MKFTEVYSGPNAPLSQAIGREFATAVPGSRLETRGEGIRNELQTLAQVLRGQPVATGATREVEVEDNF